MVLRAATTLLVLLQSAFAADVFSGSLERLGNASIAIRLKDQRVIEARLPSTASLAAGKIAARYKLGDHVQIRCDRIQPAWDEDASRYQFLELTRLQFLRAPSPEELSKIVELPAWREGTNLLVRPDAPEAAFNKGRTDTPRTTADAEARKLEHAREVNLGYASNMPNFVADETAKRYTSSSKSTEWRYLDTIETEITFKGNRADRQQIRRDGTPWERPFQALPGFKWSGGFGTEIRPLFDFECPTSIEYQGRADVRGKPVLEYRFNSPPDGCFGDFYFEYQRYNPARTGHIFIDDPGSHVIQLEEEAEGFPAGFEFAHRTEEVSWDYVKIGDATHLLPVGATFVVFYSSGNRYRVEVEYKNHRHFEASTNVTFH